MKHNNGLLVVKQWTGALDRVMPSLKDSKNANLLLYARSLFRPGAIPFIITDKMCICVSNYLTRKSHLYTSTIEKCNITVTKPSKTRQYWYCQNFTPNFARDWSWWQSWKHLTGIKRHLYEGDLLLTAHEYKVLKTRTQGHKRGFTLGRRWPDGPDGPMIPFQLDSDLGKYSCTRVLKGKI